MNHHILSLQKGLQLLLKQVIGVPFLCNLSLLQQPMHAGFVKLSFAFMCGCFCVAGDVTWVILPLKHGKLQQVFSKIVFHLKPEKSKNFFKPHCY